MQVGLGTWWVLIEVYTHARISVPRRRAAHARSDNVLRMYVEALSGDRREFTQERLFWIHDVHLHRRHLHRRHFLRAPCVRCSCSLA